MGNEKSAPSGLKIDEKPIEITDFWAHYMACVNGHNVQRISVFISEPSLHYSANFGNASPLEKAAKNLMLYRHPCILKYISSWSKGSKFFLATEQVKPLIQSLETQNTLQICMGLYSILRALVFLHEKASVSHNNLCESSIYVTPEGCWKLGGLECLCKFNELTSSYLQKIRNYRYKKAISCNEDTIVTSTSFTTIDVYAFGILAEDILKLKDPGDVPSLLEFKQFCKENLQNSDPSLRSELSHVLQHPFFTHDFMRIYAFLDELPLKNSQEKEIFFGTLITQLRMFPENIVAEQLGRLLLSRMVLLDTTAQEQLLPFILKPKGAATVIGGKRGKLFTDGRPKKLKDNKKTENSINIVQFTVPTNSIQKIINLPERPSPDGGEDKKEIASSIIEEEYTWSDWDIQETGDVHLRISRPSQSQSPSNDILVSDSTLRITTNTILNIDKDKASESKLIKKSTVLSDISELDIKNSKLIDTLKEEYDYFTDMEPVIKKTQILHVQQAQILSKSVFDIKIPNGLEIVEENNGWDEDLSDWGTEDIQEVKT
ncbi:PREDICTED: protein-associating with the carboxyl-terminal domain of ezrin isoform X2 [Eufriesea mexicana]|uniref:protein-associating with the carboxyl-terminal domain of ezrin isoform X2 n=1 Tax=Eufriesea mexicana TaxID=516756 RepID=UPI00083C5498|nr:PREDICTED: protein-associating with the carboxyl-terminal domain of ezrin isoform X2 [Eufriesea mexicana]